MIRLALFPLLSLVAAATGAEGNAAPRTRGALAQEAYLWQRAWPEPVIAAAAEHGSNFAAVVALAAEVSWKSGRPAVIRPAIHHPTLRDLRRPVGLALRIGPFAGPFAADDEQTRELATLAASLVDEARSNGLAVAELQVDFDCAESKLDGYRLWVEAIRRRVAPTPVAITALPAWLKRPAFQKLAKTAGGFVLQVHSLERPGQIDAPFTLCDPAQARRAVEQAARAGVPFRVALPTYGYFVAFDGAGKFVALSAEGPSMSWPEGVQLRDVRADPAAMAGLVSGWVNDRPALLRGVIWYRLPVDSDRLNWRWPTLANVMAGRIPEPELETATRQPEPALVEIHLQNRGNADEVRPVQVAVRWRDGRVVASDGLLGFDVFETGINELQFRTTTLRLEAGGSQGIGWVRFDKATDVRVEIQR